MRKESPIRRFTSKLDRYLWAIPQEFETTLMPLLSINEPQAQQKDPQVYDKRQLIKLHEDFQQLQELTQQLLQAQDAESTAKIALVGIEDILQYSIAGIWLVNDCNTRLEPTSMTQEAGEIISTQPVYIQEQKSLSWQAFDSQTSRRIDSMDTHPDRYNAETQIKSELIVPIGKFGILNIGSTEPDAFSDEDLRRVEAWIGTVESAMDRLERITDLREREASLQRERKRLAEFAEMISHDLQNPLNIAVGYLTRAQNICSCEELEKIDSALDRMEIIIDETLTLAKQGDTVDQCEPVVIPQLVESCVPVTDIDDDSIEVVDEFTIKADPNRLAHVFENLCQNAVDHGGSDVSVTIGKTTDGFYVADDGIGVPPDEQDEIFETGYTTSQDGTGLGLQIVNRVVEAHNWSISITTSASGGARFDITGVTFAEN
jgi:signal transduction histidine kinase